MKKMKKLFIDLWEGNITLWKTYWYLTLAGLIYYLPIYFLVPEDRYSVFAFAEIFSLFYMVFFLIVVWRSANKYKGKKKLIGICLGYQQILFNEKGKIVQQKNIYHGYQSKVRVTNQSKLFNYNKIFKVGRYHSLKLFEPFMSNDIKISMRCVKTNIPMGIEDLKNNIYGFQFHPESFLTENGNFIIKKILSA